MTDCAAVSYQGHVQGVGFRATCRIISRGYEVFGYVRNLPDGSVELEAEGCRSEIEAFLTKIRESALSRFIHSEQVTWSSCQSRYKTFEIRHG